MSTTYEMAHLNRLESEAVHMRLIVGEVQDDIDAGRSRGQGGPCASRIRLLVSADRRSCQ